jgi:16S rRNA (cytidine1402-2'-O)-methyltransferase
LFLNKRTEVKEHQDFIKPLLEGKNIGLMSEAGCPGVADPGAVIVKLAHEKEYKWYRRTFFYTFSHDGSGMNGQSFTFHGYLPIEKRKK